MATSSIRRVVTRHDTEGNADIAIDALLPTVFELDAIPGAIFHQAWSTEGAPSRVGNGPPSHVRRNPTAAAAHIGAARTSKVKANSTHPLMHRTLSIDYRTLI